MEVSVVVPTYNRRPVLERTIECLLRQDAGDLEYELVVVDDQSTDDTWAWLHEAKRHEDRLLCVQNPKKGRGQARNAGTKASRGEVICFVDDDVWVFPEFVAAHWRAHQELGPMGVVIGALGLCPETAKSIPNEYEDARLLRVERRIQAADDQLGAGFFRTGNVSVRRELLGKVGGFDESFRGYSYEDSELGYRLKAGGGVFHYAPDAVGAHYTQTTVAQILGRRAEAGASAVVFLRRWPQAVSRGPAPFPVPGIETTARHDSVAKQAAKSLLLSTPARAVMVGLLGGMLRLGLRRTSFALLDRLSWWSYSDAFRNVVTGAEQSPDEGRP